MWCLIVTVGVLAFLAVGILWACCVVSGRCSREEERREMLAEALADKPALWDPREFVPTPKVEDAPAAEDDQAAEDEQAYQRMVGEGLGLIG